MDFFFERWKEIMKLEPCPFCGEIPEVHPLDPDKDGNGWAEVVCVNDKCNYFGSPEKSSRVSSCTAIKNWNTRDEAKGKISVDLAPLEKEIADDKKAEEEESREARRSQYLRLKEEFEKE
jgi:hypothetical protein